MVPRTHYIETDCDRRTAQCVEHKLRMLIITTILDGMQKIYTFWLQITRRNTNIKLGKLWSSSSWDMNWNELINTAQIFLRFSHQFIIQSKYVCSIMWLLIILSHFKSSSTKNNFRLTNCFIIKSKDFNFNG